MMLLAGKVGVITGGGSGIGRVAARTFAREAAAAVVIAGRRTSEGEATVAEVRALGTPALFVATDVTREADVAALVAKAVETFGRLDVAFNNAGVEQEAQPLPDQDEATYERIMATNVKGVWLAMKHQIPALLAAGGGAIVNMSSIAGLVGFAGAPLYTAAKHAVVGLTRAVALEYAAQRIRVNCVNPGAVDTEMFDRFVAGSPERRAQLQALHPMGRIASPEEIADAVVWLLSDRAAFVTGQPLPVDGGFTAA